MKKIPIFVIAAIILSVGYWLVSPFFINKTVSEELVMEAGDKIVSTGSFVGFDRVHTGSGDVHVVKTENGYVIRFEDNFNVANGPDLYVGLGKDGEYKEETEIARLKGNIGSQNYSVPTNINIDDYNEVWIWCRAFSVPFAKAELK